MIRQVLAFAMSLAVFAAQAQETPAPPPPPAPPAPRAAASAPSAEQMRRAMETGFNAMGPAMAKMQDAMVESTLHIAEQPETAQRIATFKKNLYDALLQKGFTKQQALAITLGTQLPSFGK